jgi:quercetin dioxygenase-like cupin family protein
MDDFPDIITALPHANIPIEGLSSYLFQGENTQILFMKFEKSGDVPEHSHEAQWGVVLNGEMILTIENQELILRRGDEYYIPKGKMYRAKIKAGYRDITLYNQKDRYKTVSED